MDDKMLARVRKLLAKAEAAGVTDAERDSLTNKAAELMAAYGIDEALAAVRDPGRDSVTDKRIVVDPPFARAKTSLFAAVAVPLRCRALRLETPTGDGRNRLRFTMHVFGFRSDIERAEILYTSLLLQAANGLKNVPAPYGNRGAAFRDSWLEGFAAAVYIRLSAAEKRAADSAEDARDPYDGESVALVLADRAALVDRAASAAYPKTEATTRRLSGRGRTDGYQAGLRADLGTAGNVGRGGRPTLTGGS